MHGCDVAAVILMHSGVRYFFRKICSADKKKQKKKKREVVLCTLVNCALIASPQINATLKLVLSLVKKGYYTQYQILPGIITCRGNRGKKIDGVLY